MPSTLSDVAARAGVSRSAVSRTFTKGGSVSPGLRAKVEIAARELGYRPNSLAASLKTGRTGLIALICDDFGSSQTLAMQARLTRALEAAGRQAVLLNIAGETDPGNATERLRDHHVDGALLVASDLDPEIEAAVRRALPATIACLSRAGGGEAAIDDVQAGRLAGRKLHARGYRRIAYVGGPKRMPATRDRLAGLRAAARAREIDIAVQYAPEISVPAGHKAVQRLIEKGDWDAYFCADDLLALGALSALEDAGIDVPRTAGVLGVGDLTMASWPHFSLSTLRPPKDAIAEAAVSELIAALEDGTPPEAQRFACRLVERGTLRPLPPSA